MATPHLTTTPNSLCSTWGIWADEISFNDLYPFSTTPAAASLFHRIENKHANFWLDTPLSVSPLLSFSSSIYTCIYIYVCTHFSPLNESDLHLENNTYPAFLDICNRKVFRLVFPNYKSDLVSFCLCLALSSADSTLRFYVIVSYKALGFPSW